MGVEARGVAPNRSKLIAGGANRTANPRKHFPTPLYISWGPQKSIGAVGRAVRADLRKVVTFAVTNEVTYFQEECSLD